jgi:hypothetical protein
MMKENGKKGSSLEGLPNLPNIQEISVDGNPIRTLSV